MDSLLSIFKKRIDVDRSPAVYAMGRDAGEKGGHGKTPVQLRDAADARLNNLHLRSPELEKTYRDGFMAGAKDAKPIVEVRQEKKRPRPFARQRR